MKYPRNKLNKINDSVLCFLDLRIIHKIIAFSFYGKTGFKKEKKNERLKKKVSES